jgi:hypothetical protein
MFSKIRKRITFANVAMTLALVFAMTGGAYAAGKYLITSTKQIKPSVLAQLKGKNGTSGTNGTNGTNGKDGAQGTQGPVGEKGSAGEKGDAGAQGLKGATGPAGASGPAGAAGPQGAAGPTGPEGSPWTAGGTLPSGKTEIGMWALSASAEGPVNFTAISFTIGLEETLAASKVEFIPQGSTTANCKGSSAVPTAARGFLCVYESGMLNLSEPRIVNVGLSPGASRNGAILNFNAGASAPRYALGGWAVTAP